MNENDTVTTADLTVGDNDNLAALVAQVCDADSLFTIGRDVCSIANTSAITKEKLPSSIIIFLIHHKTYKF